jgi:hypothetical protein
MNDQPKSVSERISKYASIVCGIGGGVLLSTVLYKYFSVADLTDPLRIIGFVLALGGAFLARPKPSRK